jgi:hypothetical protein
MNLRSRAVTILLQSRPFLNSAVNGQRSCWSRAGVSFFSYIIAYNLALGRRTSARPIIVYAQHVWSNETARYLVEDFPRSVFIHTIRDPLSSYNSLVRMIADGISRSGRSYEVYRHAMLGKLTQTDRPHQGRESRTRTIRLEDLHRDPAGIMRDLCGWLGLTYRTTLRDSTFNGIPYLVKRNGTTWSGQNLQQSQRSAPDLTLKDRALLYALFHENFMAWKYHCPKILGNPIVRCTVVACLFLFPLGTEILAARAVWKYRILPSLRNRDLSLAIKSAVGIALVRLKIMWLLVSVVLRRCVYRPALLYVHDGTLPAGNQ